MERTQTYTVEKFIGNWNGDFPNNPLTPADLKKPHAVMGALFQVFDRLGIDIDAVLAAPPKEDRNENTIYYWDLLPVINTTRVINHLVSVMPQVDATISIIHFLQPTATTSHSILLLLFNLMVFNEEQLRNIAPHEEELFAKTDQVKALEEKKNRLLEMLNEQAEEKGKRAGRLEKLDHDIRQFEEELKQEKEVHDEERQELEAILKENRQTELLLEQKKTHREALVAEVARKRALRVYDAEDIKSQAEQATQNLQELEEKLDSLRDILMQKENSLKNLQTIKPNLDSANNLLHEIMKLSDSLKDFESGDLESDSKEGELDVLNTELGELAAQLAELQVARDDTAGKRSESQARRQQDRTVAHSALREAEEKDKKLRERSKEAVRRTEEIKELTTKYEAEKIAGFEQIALIKNEFSTQVLVALSFYATGSYQRLVGGTQGTMMSQQSVSRAIREVTNALNANEILNKWLKFPHTRRQRDFIKQRFYEKFRIPAVAGCIDGTHVAIVRPSQNEERFYNRKGYHSRNVLIIKNIDELLQKKVMEAAKLLEEKLKDRHGWAVKF